MAYDFFQGSMSNMIGSLAEDFHTDPWTLPRVGQLIEHHCGGSYSESKVWRILVSLGVSCQRSSVRKLERDEAAIKRWKQTRWLALKTIRPLFGPGYKTRIYGQSDPLNGPRPDAAPTPIHPTGE